MSGSVVTGLARVTVAAPRRRVDVALPEQVAVAELLPGLLRSAGEELADAGQRHGGWVLRRADGQLLESGRSLGAQSVRDGEVLHLVPAQAEWPELDYDDVVDAIASGARRASRSWGGAATRVAGLLAAVLVLVAALGVIVSTGPSWTVPGALAVGLAALLTGASAALARGVADSGAGAAAGLVAMPAAFVGALVVLHGDRALVELRPAQYLTACAALFAVSLLVYVGVGDRTHHPVAGMTAALLGAVGSVAAMAWALTAVEVAAVLVTAVVALTPAVPLLAIRLGKLPVPPLPTTAEDLLADQPVLPRSRVQARVRRSDELLTGMLAGGCLVAGVSVVLLGASGNTSAVVLAALVAGASLLRARLFPAALHRIPLLLVGGAGALGLVGGALALSPGLRSAVVVPALVVVAALLAAAGLAYQRRAPSPYLGRLADVVDVLVVLAVVPVACAVLGLYGYVRGLAG